MKNIMNEKLSLSSDSPIKARFYEYDHFSYPWHFHSELEIIYIRESSGTRFIGNSSQSYAAGDILLLGSNLPHYLKSAQQYHNLPGEKKVRGTIVQFEQQFMYYSIRHYPHLLNIKNLLDESQNGIYFPSGCSGKLIRLLETLPTQSGLNQLCSLLFVLEEMAAVTSRQIISTRDFMDNSTYADSRLDKIVSFVNQNYTRPIKLKEIASYASMNSSAFCRFFRRKTGKTFVQFVCELRIAYACKLLLIDDQPISQIGSLCGFETVSHFNKTFKSIKGMSPTLYREVMLNG